MAVVPTDAETVGLEVLEKEIRGLSTHDDWSDYTEAVVRRKVEATLGLGVKSLDARKREIRGIISKIFEEQDAMADDSDDDSDSDNEDGEGESESNGADHKENDESEKENHVGRNNANTASNVDVDMNADGGEDDADADGGAPKKRKRLRQGGGPKAKRKRLSAIVDDDDDDDDDVDDDYNPDADDTTNVTSSSSVPSSASSSMSTSAKKPRSSMSLSKKTAKSLRPTSATAKKRRPKKVQRTSQTGFQSARGIHTTDSSVAESSSEFIVPRYEDDFHFVTIDGKELNVMLNQTNINRNNNKFYQIQLVESHDFNDWHLMTKWGRVGAPRPQMQDRDDFVDVQEAIMHFKRKFRDKTKNTWGRPFVPVHQKYQIVQTAGALAQDPDEVEEEEDEGSLPECTLNGPVKALIEMICSKELRIQTMKSMQIDMSKLPLGQLSRQQLLKGYEILRKVASSLRLNPDREALMDLSSQFYTHVPHDFGMRIPPVISSSTLLKQKIELLETLSDIELTSHILKRTRGAPRQHPVDRNYAALRTTLGVLARDSEQFTLIEKAVRGTHADTHDKYSLEIEQIYSVDRAGSSRRFAPFRRLKNHRMLWHGSRVANFVGILRKGLRIAPPEVPKTGYMFGKGIYFADVVSKSANYIRARPGASKGLLVLADVALGEEYHLKEAKYLEKPPVPYHSTKGLGKTIPDSTSETTLDGVPFLTGPLKQSKDNAGSSLQYNEFIVYDVGAVKIRYIVEVNFGFKN